MSTEPKKVYTPEEIAAIKLRMEKEQEEYEKNQPRMAPFFRKSSSQRLYEEGRRGKNK